jgi:hypothetical protein
VDHPRRLPDHRGAHAQRPEDHGPHGRTYTLGKPAHHQKIDAAVTTVLAHEAAADERAAGWRTSRATLYMPNATTWLVMGTNGWTIEDRDEHELGSVPVVPVVNKGRTHDRYGLSQMGRTIGSPTPRPAR